LGLTQQHTDNLGLQRGSVGNWEYGKGINRRNAVRLVGLAEEAGLGGVTIDWLLSDREGPSELRAEPPRARGPEALSPEEILGREPSAPISGEIDPAGLTERVAHVARGAMNAGLQVRRVEIDTSGKIVIICAEGGAAAGP
jgi:hypothetical protein